MQDLGLENFFSHHYLIYQKTFQIIFFIFQIRGPPLHCSPDRPCQLIVFPIEKSLLSPPLPTPPHHISNGPPLTVCQQEILTKKYQTYYKYMLAETLPFASKRFFRFMNNVLILLCSANITLSTP